MRVIIKAEASFHLSEEWELMGLICPRCEGPDDLTVVVSLELPPDARSDEITVQLLDCPVCEWVGVGVYEESRRGSLDEEVWNHDAYEMDVNQYLRLSALMEACPSPENPGCPCPGHAALNVRDPNGVWIGLEPFHPTPIGPLTRRR